MGLGVIRNEQTLGLAIRKGAVWYAAVRKLSQYGFVLWLKLGDTHGSHWKSLAEDGWKHFLPVTLLLSE